MPDYHDEASSALAEARLAHANFCEAMARLGEAVRHIDPLVYRRVAACRSPRH